MISREDIQYDEPDEQGNHNWKRNMFLPETYLSNRTIPFNRDISGSDLRSVVFTNVNLANVTMTNCDLSKAWFNDCDFSGANLSGSDLYRATFVNCKMTGIVFTGGENLDTATVDGVNLEKILLALLNFAGINLL